MGGHQRVGADVPPFVSYALRLRSSHEAVAWLLLCIRWARWLHLSVQGAFECRFTNRLPPKLAVLLTGHRRSNLCSCDFSWVSRLDHGRNSIHLLE